MIYKWQILDIFKKSWLLFCKKYKWIYRELRIVKKVLKYVTKLVNINFKDLKLITYWLQVWEPAYQALKFLYLCLDQIEIKIW